MPKKLSSVFSISIINPILHLPSNRIQNYSVFSFAAIRGAKIKAQEPVVAFSSDIFIFSAAYPLR